MRAIFTHETRYLMFNLLPGKPTFSKMNWPYIPLELGGLINPLAFPGVRDGFEKSDSFPGFSLSVALDMVERNKRELILDMTGNLDSSCV